LGQTVGQTVGQTLGQTVGQTVDKTLGLSRSSELPSASPAKIVKFFPNSNQNICMVDDHAHAVHVLDTRSKSPISIPFGDTVFDVEPTTTDHILVSSRNRPIHLVNIHSQSIKASYTAYSLTEEIVHPYSLKSSGDATRLIGGFPSSTVRVWDLQVPGRQINDLIFSTRKQTGTLKGIVGAVNFLNPETILAGTYTGLFGLFDIRDKDKAMMLGSGCQEKKSPGGIVQILPVPGRNIVVSNHRNSSESLLIWDMRKPDLPFATPIRQFRTQQRSSIGMAHDRFLCYGDDMGKIRVYDLQSNSLVNEESSGGHGSPAACVDVSYDNSCMIVGIGQRNLSNLCGDDSDSDFEDTTSKPMLSLYNLVANS